MTSSPSHAPLALAFAMSLTTGCTTPSELLALRCDVYVSSIAPETAEVGESVILSGKPYTSVYDSAVYVGNSRATVTGVDRDNCATCDACRVQAGCTECGDCDVCDQECSINCVETVTFTVPEVDGGVHGVQLFNGHGQSHIVELTVPASSPVDDSGQDDTGPLDTGADTGPPDTGGLAPIPSPSSP